MTAPALAPRPRIKLLATGGTIAGAQTGADSISYRAGVLSAEALLAAVPNLDRLAEVEVSQIMHLGSQDIDDASWARLHHEVTTAADDPQIGAIVITHGTDTLEETAYLLNLTLTTTKPVILVGAMRPATAISPDGPMNLYNAVSVALHPEAPHRGLLVVANDEIHFAREVTKTNTTQVGTFRSTARGLAGLVTFGRVTWFSPSGRRHTQNSAFACSSLGVLPRVDIHYAHAGLRRDLLDASVQQGARGLIIAGVGAGNLSRPARAALEDALRQGLVGVRSSRTGGGLVERNVEIDDDTLGTVVAEDLNPQKARILLMLGLSIGADSATLQQLYRTH
jgi:L-asparaginase